MKKIVLTFSLIFMTVVILCAQSTHVDSRLDAVYSEDYINNLIENNPQQLKYLNWYLDNSYTIVTVGLEKSEYMPYLKHLDPLNKIVGENVESIDQEDFNIFMYQFDRGYDKKAYYRIGNTGTAIVLESKLKLAKNFNTYSDEN